MYTIESPGVFALPPQDGPIQARFDGEQHPLLQNLNEELDARGKYHGNAMTGSAPGYVFDRELGGDPFYLASSVSACVKKLAADGHEELALETLDIASRWPGTTVGRSDYSDVACSAARRGKVDFALAVALDSRRMFGPHGARQYSEIVPFSEVNPNEANPAGAVYDANLPYHRAQFAQDWLSGVCYVYREAAKSDVAPDESLRTRVGGAIDLYSTIFDAQLKELALSADNGVRVKSLLTGLGLAAVWLQQANELERAGYLERLAMPGNS